MFQCAAVFRMWNLCGKLKSKLITNNYGMYYDCKINTSRNTSQSHVIGKNRVGVTLKMVKKVYSSIISVFLNGKTEFTYYFAKMVILAVAVGHDAGFFEREESRFGVEIAGISADIHHFGYEHIV